MRPLIVGILLQLFFSSTVHSQDIDSMQRAFDSSNKAILEASKRIDSLARVEEMRRFNERNTNTLNQFLADRKKQEESENRKMYIYIGLGVAFLIILMIRVLKTNKEKNKPV